MRWRDLKMGRKLGIGFGSLAILLLFTGIVGYYGIQTVSDSLFKVGDEQAPVADMSMEMKLALMTTRNAMEEFKSATAVVATDDEGSLSDIEKTYQQAIENFDQYADAILNGADLGGIKVIKTDNPELADLVKQADKIHNEEFQGAARDMMEKGRHCSKARRRPTTP